MKILFTVALVFFCASFLFRNILGIYVFGIMLALAFFGQAIIELFKIIEILKKKKEADNEHT